MHARSRSGPTLALALLLASPSALAQQPAAPTATAPAATSPAAPTAPASAPAPASDAPAPVAIAAPVPPLPPPPPRRWNGVHADLGLGVIGLAYERAFHERFAVQIGAHIFGTWFGPAFGFANFTGFGGQIRPTIFLVGDAPGGLYLAPYFRAEWVTAQANGATGSGVGWSAGLFLGYSFVIANRVVIRLGGGAQYLSYVVNAGGTELSFRSFFPAIDGVIGIVF